jgi:hypothetical protein
MLLQAVGLCLFLGVAPAAETQRLATVALPATILLVWILNSWRRVGRAILAALAAGALVFAYTLPVRTQTCRRTFSDLPAGRAAFDDEGPPFREVLQWVLGHTRPGDFFLFTDGMGPFQLLAGVRNPGPVECLTSYDFTRPEQVREVVRGLEKHQVRFVVWCLQSDTPGVAGPASDPLGPLRAYLHGHYRVVKTFPELGLVWERVDSVSR